MGGRLIRGLAVALVIALATLMPAAQAQDSAVRSTARIHIGLAHDTRPVVALTTGVDQLVLELPRGASFPDDFAASSGGMLRNGSVERGDDGVRVTLNLALGVLHRVVYEPDGLVLEFSSRFDPAGSPDEPQDQYRLGPDDRIKVTVHNQPELTAELVVTREGLVTAPLVGDVRAAGLSPRRLAGRVAELLGRDYLVDPQVDVSVVDYLSQWVIVSGEVEKPGRIPLRGGTRLKEVIGDAEGFGPDAGDRITISRSIPGTDEVKQLEIGRADFEAGRSDPFLVNGDIVEVSLAEYVYIQGEVNSPGRTPVERDLSLMRLISMADGLTDWADRKNVKILRDGEPQVYNLKKIESGRLADPQIRGGDVIIVRKRFL